jgi:L-threonylcarbamoyladenylate synthase
MNFEIKNAVKVLNNGGLILYPTDTVWGIGCDATNPEAVKKIFKIKKRKSKNALICLVSNINMLKDYITKIPKGYESLITDPVPTTIIYNNPIGVAHNLVARDNTLGIRIPNHEFCNRLITEFSKPIVSTSANISQNKTPSIYSEISSTILEGVDHVVNLQKEKTSSLPSRIFKIDIKGKLQIIRE